MGPAGVWGRGLSRPQRRDLQGPKNIRAGGLGDTPKNSEAVSFKNNRPAQAGRKAFDLVKLKASKLSIPPGQGAKSRLGEAESFKL